MTNQAYASTALERVTGWTDIQKDDSHIKSAAKFSSGLALKVATVAMAFIEMVACKIATIPAYALRHQNPERYANISEQANSAKNTIFEGCRSLKQIHAKQPTEAETTQPKTTRDYINDAISSVREKTAKCASFASNHKLATGVVILAAIALIATYYNYPASSGSSIPNQTTGDPIFPDATGGTLSTEGSASSPTSVTPSATASTPTIDTGATPPSTIDTSSATASPTHSDTITGKLQTDAPLNVVLTHTNTSSAIPARFIGSHNQKMCFPVESRQLVCLKSDSPLNASSADTTALLPYGGASASLIGTNASNSSSASPLNQNMPGAPEITQISGADKMGFTNRSIHQTAVGQDFTHQPTVQELPLQQQAKSVDSCWATLPTHPRFSSDKQGVGKFIDFMKSHNCWDFKNPDVYHQAFGSDASLYPSTQRNLDHALVHQIDTIAQSHPLFNATDVNQGGKVLGMDICEVRKTVRDYVRDRGTTTTKSFLDRMEPRNEPCEFYWNKYGRVDKMISGAKRSNWMYDKLAASRIPDALVGGVETVSAIPFKVAFPIGSCIVAYLGRKAVLG